jgi:hypothetical protein
MAVTGFNEDAYIAPSAIQGSAPAEAPTPDEPSSFHEPYSGRHGHHSGLPMPPEYVDLDS